MLAVQVEGWLENPIISSWLKTLPCGPQAEAEAAGLSHPGVQVSHNSPDSPAFGPPNALCSALALPFFTDSCTCPFLLPHPGAQRAGSQLQIRAAAADSSYSRR